VVFCPSVAEMYPDGSATKVTVERLGVGLCVLIVQGISTA